MSTSTSSLQRRPPGLIHLGILPHCAALDATLGPTSGGGILIHLPDGAPCSRLPPKLVFKAQRSQIDKRVLADVRIADARVKPAKVGRAEPIGS